MQARSPRPFPAAWCSVVQRASITWQRACVWAPSVAAGQQHTRWSCSSSGRPPHQGSVVRACTRIAPPLLALLAAAADGPQPTRPPPPPLPRVAAVLWGRRCPTPRPAPLAARPGYLLRCLIFLLLRLRRLMRFFFHCACVRVRGRVCERRGGRRARLPPALSFPMQRPHAGRQAGVRDAGLGVCGRVWRVLCCSPWRAWCPVDFGKGETLVRETQTVTAFRVVPAFPASSRSLNNTYNLPVHQVWRTAVDGGEGARTCARTGPHACTRTALVCASMRCACGASMHSNTRTHKHACTHAHAHACTHALCVWSQHAKQRTHSHGTHACALLWTYASTPCVCGASMHSNTHKHACTHAHTHACTHTHCSGRMQARCVRSRCPHTRDALPATARHWCAPPSRMHNSAHTRTHARNARAQFCPLAQLWARGSDSVQMRSCGSGSLHTLIA